MRGCAAATRSDRRGRWHSTLIVFAVAVMVGIHVRGGLAGEGHSADCGGGAAPTLSVTDRMSAHDIREDPDPTLGVRLSPGGRTVAVGSAARGWRFVQGVVDSAPSEAISPTRIEALDVAPQDRAEDSVVLLRDGSTRTVAGKVLTKPALGEPREWEFGALSHTGERGIVATAQGGWQFVGAQSSPLRQVKALPGAAVESVRAWPGGGAIEFSSGLVALCIGEGTTTSTIKDAAPRSLFVAKDGGAFGTLSREGEMRLFRIPGAQEMVVRRSLRAERARSAAWMIGTSSLLIGYVSGDLGSLSLRTGGEAMNAAAHDRPVQACAASSDGRIACTLDDGGRIRLWRRDADQRWRAIRGPTAGVTKLAVFCRAGESLAVSATRPCIWRPDSMTAGSDLDVRGVVAVAPAAPDARAFVLTSDHLAVASLEAGAREQEVLLRGRSFSDLAVTPDGRRLVVCRGHGTESPGALDDWQPSGLLVAEREGASVGEFVELPGSAPAVSLHASDTICVAGVYGGIDVWDLATRVRIASLSVPEPADVYRPRWMLGVSASDDARVIAAVDFERAVHLWRRGVSSWVHASVDLGEKVVGSAIDVTADGRFLFVGRTDGTLSLIDARCGHVAGSISIANARLSDVVATDSGNTLFVGTYGGDIVRVECRVR